MIARLIMKKSPKIFSYVLWSVVFVRLIIPFGIQVDFNMKDGKNTISRYIPSTFLQNDMELSNIEYKNEKITVKPEGTTNLGKGNSSEASSNNFRVKGYIVRLLSCVWWSGVILLLTLSIISYFKMKGVLKKSKHIKDNIYLCSDIETPFVFGIINPNILKVMLNLTNCFIHIIYILMMKMLNILYQKGEILRVLILSRSYMNFLRELKVKSLLV